LIRKTSILLILLATSCVSRSHGTMVASPPSPSTQSTQAVPILYHRTGGIAGTDDRVVIWPDRFVQINGKLLTPATARLSKERLDHLRSMFRGWAQLKPEYLSDANDAYNITISYGGKSVSAADLAPDLPDQFRQIYTEIEAIAAAAENADPKPVPESP
jgi:hypothetical protein